MKRRKKIAVLLCILAIFAALLLDSNLRIVCDEYEISSERLPPEFDGFRIVQLSDLHERMFGKENSRLISAVVEQKPDIIAITGDMVDRPGESEYITTLVSALSEIAPVYYVTGNHEWATKEPKTIMAAVQDGGGTVLRNRYLTIERDGSEIIIAGIDDPNGPYDMKTPQELSDSIVSEKGDTFSVLLAHRNDPEYYTGVACDVILCGHAHGGIVRLPIVGGLLGNNHKFFPKHTDGVEKTDGSTMVISRGLGNVSIIPRFLNNPQIPIIVLKSS